MKNEIICENRPLFNSLLLTPSFLKIAYLSLLSLVSDNSLMESIALPVIKKMIPIYTPTNNTMALRPTAYERILILLLILKEELPLINSPILDSYKSYIIFSTASFPALSFAL